MDGQPGERVAGRYRLERVLVDVPHVTLWRGHDEILDRPVAVRLVAGDHPRTREILDAARSTACVEDRRIARVLDADTWNRDGSEGAGTDVYVVTAWADGTDLSHVLRDGPLDAADALALVGEVADAVVDAHERGLPHLALDPTNVMVAGHDVVLLGLAVDAVLWETAVPGTEPARADAAGLGALLYACLTARWPYGEDDAHGLVAAPRVGTRLCTPRQVRAAVPPGADALCRRALGLDPMEQPVASPAEFATDLHALLDAGGRGRWRPSGWLRRPGRTPRTTASR